MLSYKEIEVPDIGDFRSVQVVEILVQEGERVEVDTPLITVKTDKGPMDVPSPLAGNVTELIVQVEDRVTKGSSILLLETEVDDPAPQRPQTAPVLDRMPELDLEPDGKIEPVWEIEPIIDPTTTEPRIPGESFPDATPADLEDTDEHDIPTLLEEVSALSPDTNDGFTVEAATADEEFTLDVTTPDEDSRAQDMTGAGVEYAGEDFIDNEAATESDGSAIDDSPVYSDDSPGTQSREEIPAPAADEDAESTENMITVTVPDIGDFADVEVIEVHVAAGDEVRVEDPLITLESDKATMDVPSSAAGVVSAVLVQVGDSVSEGSAVVRVGQAAQAPTAPAELPAVDDGGPPEAKAEPVPTRKQEPQTQTQPDKPVATKSDMDTDAEPVARGDTLPPPGTPQPPAKPQAQDDNPHASPGVRKFARELGVDLTRVTGKGPKGRILKEDVQRWVKKTLTETPSVTAAPESTGTGIPEIPYIDFSQFGDIETKPLSRIKKLTAVNLSRSWLNVPHVTQHDEADITELEAFRQDLKREEETKTGARITMLSFLMKACVVALKEFPAFNSSLEKGGENLILKRYYHLGIAVETPEGLVVPVVKDVDQKSIRDLAGELGDISSRARERKLSPKDLQGASFTISSLGGIGGTAFTPIVNAPEVAILGVSRSSMKPVYDKGEFVPRLILPMSLSYDHRVIDGAQAARFTTFLARVLADVRRILL